MNCIGQTIICNATGRFHYARISSEIFWKQQNNLEIFSYVTLGPWAYVRSPPTGSATRVSYTVSNFMKWPTKIGPSFSPIIRKFCILLHCQASYTQVIEWNSTKLCQTVGGESRYQRAVKVLGLPLEKMGSKLSTFASSFRWLRDLMTNVFVTEYAINKEHWKVQRVLSLEISANCLSKFRKVWFTNGWK